MQLLLSPHQPSCSLILPLIGSVLPHSTAHAPLNKIIQHPTQPEQDSTAYILHVFFSTLTQAIGDGAEAAGTHPVLRSNNFL